MVFLFRRLLCRYLNQLCASPHLRILNNHDMMLIKVCAPKRTIVIFRLFIDFKLRVVRSANQVEQNTKRHAYKKYISSVLRVLLFIICNKLFANYLRIIINKFLRILLRDGCGVASC